MNTRPASVVIAAIAGIVVLELYALHCGIDGILFGSSVATIGLLGGVSGTRLWDSVQRQRRNRD